jgi:uncharacterized coiled-coil protein SlyX
MSALSRVPKLSRLASERRPKASPGDALRAPPPSLSTGTDKRLTEPGPKSDNRARSENARKWLAAGSLDRDADAIAATVNRLVSALDSRNRMTPPRTPFEPAPAARPAEPAGARAAPDDLSFAEGADFREVARRIAEFRQARPDPANAAHRDSPAASAEAESTDPQAPSPSSPRTVAAPSADAQRTGKRNVDWRIFLAPADEVESTPVGAARTDRSRTPKAAPAAVTMEERSRQTSARMRPLTYDDWPLSNVPDVPAAADARPATDERPAASDSSLRQRLAALRARSMAETAPAPAEAPETTAPAAPARRPLDTSDAFAKAMLAQFEEDDWLDADEAAVPDEAAVHPAPVDEIATDLPGIAADFATDDADDADEEVQTWAAGEWAPDVTNESLLAALDAHLAADDTDFADAAAADSAVPEDETAWAPDADDEATVEEPDPAADRRLALEAASRAEEIARTTGHRIDDLAERLGRIEAQDLTSRFTGLAGRFDRIDARLAEISAPAAPIDLSSLAAPMQAMEARLARLEAAAADQHAALGAMISTISDRVASAPEAARRLATIEHHMQELSRRVETHEVNLRAMKALADALDRLEARLAQPRPQVADTGRPAAPRQPAADTAPHAGGRAAAAAPRPAIAPVPSPAERPAMSEREAILERYRRQSRVRDES